VAAGKSILRVLSNRSLAAWSSDIRGLVVDLGSGGTASYRRTWDDRDASWVRVDLDPRHQPSVVADFTRTLPFADGSADTVILSWSLNLAPHPLGVLVDVRRILRPGGPLIMTVPLVFNPLPEPHDYWRFTDEGIALLLAQAGFHQVTVVPVGGRWSAAGFLTEPFLRPRRLLGLPYYVLCRALDRLTARVAPTRLPPCPVSYCVRAAA
jgi:SAM-dependent methyltransferase